MASYQPHDPSWDSAVGNVPATNLIGPAGALVADIFLQSFGLAAFLFPLLVFALGWKWIRSEALEAPLIKLFGSGILLASACGAAALLPRWRLFDNAIMPGGTAGFLIADSLKRSLNLAGTAVVLATALVLSTYLVSTFTLAKLGVWLAPVFRILERMGSVWRRSIEWRREEALRRREEKREAAEAQAFARQQRAEFKPPVTEVPLPDLAATQRMMAQNTRRTVAEPEPELTAGLPWDDPEPARSAEEPEPVATDEIPICQLADTEPASAANVVEFPFSQPIKRDSLPKRHTIYRLPATDLLNEIPVRSVFDEQELKNTAAAIKAKFEEFNVFGSVVQINPGPVVTTFEFKPEAGIKYSRITSLVEDLCLGLQAESILIERIPGKPTVGIEVPNTKREVISLRAVIESEEFQDSSSYLTISMGKDINGRIKVAALDSMPHALIAGSTGSGKSVMINSLIMSILYKSTPDEVRMIMVDPKRVELGMYEGIPHLLTPVITDPKKATNALKNAVLEMERRLRLLAEQGARNIDQYNKKIRKLQTEPRSLFEDNGPVEEEIKPLPYVLILIDELADLMMLEGRNVEESVTRLAQMARAVGMHLVLATQRPSVDVITGIIKANFPARISFRVATRVDSRTILDGMGAEHLAG